MGPELRILYPPGGSGSGPGDATVLVGLGDLLTYLQGGVWYIDPANLVIPATVSGVTITGTGGMVCNFYPTGDDEGYWVIDGSNFEAGINLEYTTVYGTAGSGNGLVWGNGMFTGSGGTAIYHALGSVDHSTLVTPADEIDFNMDFSAMIGEVYVKKGIDFDYVYTTGSGSYGQYFSWMVIQGWPWNPSTSYMYLFDSEEITTSTDGALLGEGQFTGVESTISGGSWLLSYNAYYRMSDPSPGAYTGYAWLEDDYRIIPGSQTRLMASMPSQDGIDLNISNISFATSEGPRTYRLMMSKDLSLGPTQLSLIGGTTVSGKDSSSRLVPIPVSHMGVGAASQYASMGSLVTLNGYEGIDTSYNEESGAWDVGVYPPDLPFHGSGGIELTAVSGGLWIDGTNVVGDGGIRYMVGSGTGISWGADTFAGMAGCYIQHDLGTHLHSTQITAGGDDVPTATGIAAIGGIYVTKGPNTDIVYNTGDAGEPFTWVAARGFPVYTAIDDYTGEEFTITGSVSQPTYGEGQDISMQISVPPGTWNLFYSVAFNLGDGQAGLDRGFIWLEDDEGIVDRSTSLLTAWNPMQSYSVQYASQMIQVAPLTSKTYRMKAANDSNYLAEQFILYGNSTASGSLCTLVAIPADANGFFGNEGTSSSGGGYLLIGTNGIGVDYDIDGNWTIDASNIHEHIKVEGKYGIQTYVSEGKLCIDGSNFGTGATLVSGVEIPHGEDDHSTTTLEVTSTSLGPQFGEGQDTGLDVTVSGGNWNILYSLAYQIQADSFATNDCFVWLEDDYGVISNSSMRLQSMSPMMNPMIHNVSNVVNVTPLFTTTYRLRASKYPQGYVNEFYLYGGTSASGAQCNVVALPAVYGLGDSSSLVQLEGVNNIVVTYDNGVWIIDGDFLNDLRSGWDNTGEGVYSTAKESSLGSALSITATSALPIGGAGQDTGLSVTVGSGNWNFSYSLSYELVKDQGYIGALLWIEDDFNTVISGSSKFIGDMAPIPCYGKKNIEHTFTLTTASARQYTLYATKHNEFTPDYFYIYGGPTASGATSSLLAWSPEVYATDINLVTGDITHNHYPTNNYNTYNNYYSVDEVQGLSSDGLNVTASGDLICEQAVTATGIQLTSDNYIVNTFSKFIKNTVGGNLVVTDPGYIDWVPVQSNLIGLYNGNSWVSVEPSATPSFTTNTQLLSGGYPIAGVTYDVYATYTNQDQFNLELNPWQDDTTRVVSPQIFEGVYVYDLTASGVQKRYLGMVRLQAGPEFVDIKEKRLLMNYYNKTRKVFGKNNPYSTNTSIASSTSALRRWNNNTDWLIEVLTDGKNAFELVGSLYMEYTSYGYTSFALDSTSTQAPNCTRPRSNFTGNRICFWCYSPSEGYHYIYPISIAGGSNEYYWYWNDASGRDAIYSQVDGWIWS